MKTSGIARQEKNLRGRQLQPPKSRKGILVVSLDFELYWGVYDLMEVSQCREKLIAARAAIPELLKLFVEYEIHATWATVGILFCESKQDVGRSMPAVVPEYTRPELHPYGKVETLGPDEEADPYHYAPSLIRAIASTPHQEIGSHTFSHFYSIEEGQSLKAFKADLQAAVGRARHSGFSVESLVFPRNQVNPSYLSTCADLGFKSYRGTNAGWIYAARQRHRESQFRRGIRLLDCYLNLSGHNTYDPADVRGNPVNLPSSRYLWCSSPALRAVEPLRLRRIRNEMMCAARHGRIYHLWMHPEDLGVRTDRFLAFLRRIFEIFAAARRRGEMESLNMRETVERVEALRAVNNSYADCPPVSGACQ